MTTPFSARQSLAATPHVSAAAEISMLRAVAPARRSGSQKPRMEVEPPVAWKPIRGLA